MQEACMDCTSINASGTSSGCSVTTSVHTCTDLPTCANMRQQADLSMDCQKKAGKDSWTAACTGHGGVGGARPAAPFTPGAQVVHAGLQALLPSIEVQGSELAKVGIWHEHVEALALVNVSAAVSCHVNQRSLLDLPHCTVQGLEVLGNVQLLHAAVGSHLQASYRHASHKSALMQRAGNDCNARGAAAHSGMTVVCEGDKGRMQ